MVVRRVVTGHTRFGRSVFVSDGATPRSTAFRQVRGMSTALVWETRPNGTVPAPPGDPTLVNESWLPGPGGTIAVVVTFPPDSVMADPTFDPEAASREFQLIAPGLADTFEADAPGMHTTDTIDYGVLLDGEIELELDDGQFKKLCRNDIVVQNGTRHAWRNRSSDPATMLFVLVGAERR